MNDAVKVIRHDLVFIENDVRPHLRCFQPRVQNDAADVVQCDDAAFAFAEQVPPPVRTDGHVVRGTARVFVTAKPDVFADAETR